MIREWAYGCSPFAAPTAEQQAQHVLQAQALARQIWDDGYWPIVPHLYAPQFLNDQDLHERAWGMAWGLKLLNQCVIVYVWASGPPSSGMRQELAQVNRLGLPVRMWCPTRKELIRSHG